ncbi:MAG: DUF2975 domain-containing protein [Prevotellaceae bacterium]|jgi:hypothetical protein|nr:DUF2975 domain-containing protein [Prevotellaceae bacterium]
MKRRLNILCVFVLLVLAYSLIETLYWVGLGMSAGISAGMNDVERKAAKAGSIELVYLMPERIFNGGQLSDSVYNSKSGSYVSALHTQMLVHIDTNPPIGAELSTMLLSVIDLIVSAWAVIMFIRLVIAINQSDIFSWKNVKRLRRLGYLLLIAFGCSTLSAFIGLYNFAKIFAVPGYSFVWTELVAVTNLLLGLSALIVAEVFAIGLRMKEEQDLTV